MDNKQQWPVPYPPEKRKRDRDHFMNYVKRFVDVMDAAQLQEIRDYADAKLLEELRTAAEGLLSAFGERPPGEDASITKTTQEAALNVASQILGWQTPREEAEEDADTRL